MQFLKCTFAVLLAAPIFGSAGNPNSGVTVHEWGTFTTVADAAGGEAPWSPLGAPADLPCFVVHLNGGQYKMMPSGPLASPATKVTVRMETPVLYFYSPRKTTLDVSVDLPKGLITEWYPEAAKVMPGRSLNLPAVQNGHIEWHSVQVLPGETAALPETAGASHYYAARNTDSDLIRIGPQAERLIFYRGIANFDVPLRARSTGERSVELSNTGADPVALAVLFENRDGRVGYRLLHGLTGSTTVEMPALTASLDTLQHDLAEALAGQGLFRKEADAMVATWHDSWFEEGMRVFYLVPRSLVDRELPLSISPAPEKIARVFVGREEILTPYRRGRLTTALSTGDTKTLDTFGRFLLPFREQVTAEEPWGTMAYLASQQKQAQQEFYNPTCVR